MKKQLLKKLSAFIVIVIMFCVMTEPANAQKKCHKGQCPPGYICGPTGYCVLSCGRCPPFLIESVDEILSASGSQSAAINFRLEDAEAVSVKIYDVTGRLIRTLVDERMQQGNHQIEWNTKDEAGKAVSAGIYILQFDTGNKSETKKLAVII
jgi:hypothetical protein